MAESSTKPAERSTDETIKETIESIVIAFILAFVFRAYVVEAFVIPTGSMAPTLLGAHIHVQCDQCGYEFDFDVPEEARKQVVTDGKRRGIALVNYVAWPNELHGDALGVTCPMCLWPNTIDRGTTLNSGDRILVHKYIYSFSEPRRWDVVVFKAPHLPDTNYIKRLVGLPSEQIYIFEGNIYVRPTPTPTPAPGSAPGAPGSAPSGEAGDDGADWHIARKTDRPSVQRVVWQPIYHSDYIPRDGGDRSFDNELNNPFDWSVPWVAQGPLAGAWAIDGRRSYHFAGSADDPHATGTLRFDFSRSSVENAAYVYPYNQAKGHGGLEPIEDIRIAARVEPTDRPVAVTFATTARLDNPQVDFGAERLAVTLAPTGEVTLEARSLAGDAHRILERARIDPLPVGRATRVELWYADQEASFWVDGERVLRWRYHLPLKQIVDRSRPRRRPDVSIRIVGGPATLHNVQLDRDLYYGNRMGSRIARAALIPSSGLDPMSLGPDDFFCLGDNSPQSSDSRFWEPADAWINAPDGIVPRDLMMGRAFFVYFPAPYPVGIIPLPNFGDMRFIR